MLLLCPNLPGRFAILVEVGCREVIDFVLLQKVVHLHAGFETEQPAKLTGPTARWTGKLPARGLQALREAGPSTSFSLPARCPPAVQT